MLFVWILYGFLNGIIAASVQCTGQWHSHARQNANFQWACVWQCFQEEGKFFFCLLIITNTESLPIKMSSHCHYYWHSYEWCSSCSRKSPFLRTICTYYYRFYWLPRDKWPIDFYTHTHKHTIVYLKDSKFFY